MLEFLAMIVTTIIGNVVAVYIVDYLKKRTQKNNR